MRRRRRPLSLGLLVTVALVALPVGVGAAAVSLTVGGALAGRTAAKPAARSGRTAAKPPAHSGRKRGCPLGAVLQPGAGAPAADAPEGTQGAAQLVHPQGGAGIERGRLPRTAFRQDGGADLPPSMVLAVTPGAKTTFAVQARYGNGGLHCTARLSEVVKVRMPGVVKGLKVVSRTATGAVIGWRAASRGDAPIAGYRVSLDGAVAGQTRSLRYTLLFSSSHSHRVTVTAVDTRDRLGPSSGALEIGAPARPHVAGAPRPRPKASACPKSAAPKRPSCGSPASAARHPCPATGCTATGRSSARRRRPRSTSPTWTSPRRT